MGNFSELLKSSPFTKIQQHDKNPIKYLGRKLNSLDKNTFYNEVILTYSFEGLLLWSPMRLQLAHKPRFNTIKLRQQRIQMLANKVWKMKQWVMMTHCKKRPNKRTIPPMNNAFANVKTTWEVNEV